MKNILCSSLFILLMLGCGNTDKSENSNFRTNDNSASANKNVDEASIHYYQKQNEPRENAFSLLVPKGWRIDGGIFRVDPTAQGGPSQSIAAKLDFAVKKDDNGSVMIRWLPDVLYYDARYSPAGQMGLFPQGSNYQGMTVLNIMSAKEFISNIAFPYAHPNAQNIKVTNTKLLREVAANYTRRVKQAMPFLTMSYDAAMVKLNYLENGIEFEELFVTLVENWGELGIGMWGNKETFYVRAPNGKLKGWESTFSVIQNSVKINLKWLMGEIKGQAARGQIVANTQKEIERIGREITENRQRTNSEINNDMYLTLTEQEEYVNPYTNEIEVGTDQYKYRWVNESGDVIYSDKEEYDPNIDIKLNRSDFKRSKIRKRFSQ